MINFDLAIVKFFWMAKFSYLIKKKNKKTTKPNIPYSPFMILIL